MQSPLEQLPVAEDSRESSAEDTVGQRARMPTRAQRRADALGIIAESFLLHGAEALTGGDRQQIVVHVDAETPRERSAGRCELEDGPALPADTARRLACDASVVEIVEAEAGKPLNVGRKARSIPPALRRALTARDQGCRFPGCTRTRFVDGHHIRHWADGGETKLSNLALLCRVHHRLVHEGGIVIHILDDGALQFLKADGSPYDSPRPDSPYPLPSDWRGESMDYGIAVQTPLLQAKRALNAPLTPQR